MNIPNLTHRLPSQSTSPPRGLLTGWGVVLLLLLIWQSGLFAGSRLSLEDLYFVPSPVSDGIIIVGIDDASLAAYGRSPIEWSRSVYTDLVTRLDQAKARVIAFDLLFSEMEPEDAGLAAAIQAAREGQNRTRVVMAAAGTPVLHLAGTDDASGAQPPTLRFANNLLPNATLLDAVNAIGYSNTIADVDNAIRRQPSVIKLEDDTQHLSFSLTVYLTYLRVPAAAMSELLNFDHGLLEVTPERSLPVDANGLWRQNFFGPPATRNQSTFRVVSLVDVLNGQVDPAVFEDRIVLVGLINSTRAIDQYPVPTSGSGQFMSGVEIQANAIETLLQNKPIYEQSRISQALTIIGLAILSSLLFARLRWYFKLLVVLALLIFWWVTTLTIFNLTQIVISQLYPILALVLPALISIGLDINDEARKRRQSEQMLESVVELSGQRLDIQRILVHIANDIRRIAPRSQGEIWLWDEHRSAGELGYQWPKSPDKVHPEAPDSVRKVTRTKSPLVEEARAAIPLVWQQEVLAVCTLRLPTGEQFSTRSLRLLTDLSNQIAPGLKNALLYQEVDQQRAILQAVLAGSPAGILVLDDQLNILRSNAAFSDTLGIHFATYTSQSLFTLLTGLNVDATIQQSLREQFRTANAFRIEIRIRAKSFYLDAARLAQFGGWIVVLSDITQLVELNQLRTRMIRIASHDLKNPLATAMGYTDLIIQFQGNELPEQTKEFLRTISRALRDMNQITTDILDLEQLRSGARRQEKLDIVQLAREVFARHTADAAKKHQRYESGFEAKPLFVDGDHRQLAQALSNLIGNAIKYTPDEGRVMLRVSEVGSQVRCEVQDTGYGIARDAQDRLFTEFYRVRTEATSDIPGTGLGLSLVRSIAEAHSGRVWLESAENQGSTFYLELPLYDTKRAAK